MLMFAAYFRKKGEQRTKILIPDTAHGTNPASAELCGFTAIPLASGKHGILDPTAVEELMDDETVGIMVRTPIPWDFLRSISGKLPTLSIVAEGWSTETAPI